LFNFLSEGKMKKVLFCMATLLMLAGCDTVSKYSTANANDSVKTRMRACLVSEATAKFQAGTLFAKGISATSDELVTICMKKLALQSAGISQESQSTAATIIQNLQNFGTAQ
jgi:uncharacterized lipoprotein YajG